MDKLKIKNYKNNSNKIGIYCITNLVNNKMYIGSTKRSFSSRKTKHAVALKKGNHFNKHLQLSYNKYKAENFIFGILEICEEQNVELREAYYIKYYSTNNKKFGYNKRSVAHYKFKYTLDEDVILKRSIYKKEKSKMNGLYSAEKGLQKPVNLYDFYGNFIKKFNSSREINKELGWGISSISITLTYRKLFYKNHIILFENDTLTTYDIEYVRDKYTLKCVYLYDLNLVFIQKFNSVTDCANFLNCKGPEVRMCCLGRRSRIRNYITKYHKI